MNDVRKVKTWTRARNRSLRGYWVSPWLPILLVILYAQPAALAFGPFAALASNHWTWIIFWYMCVYSVCPAQICLLNLPLTLGSDSPPKRLTTFWLASLILLAAWYGCLALAIGTGQPGTEGLSADFVAVGFWLPAYIWTLQLPFWALSTVTGWRLANRRAAAVDTSKPRLGVSILNFVALIVLTAGAYRGLWLWNPPDNNAIFVERSVTMWWRTLGIAIALLPPTAVWLRSDRLHIGLASVATVLYSLTVSLGCGLMIQLVSDERPKLPRLDGPEMQIIVAMTIGFAVPYVAGLAILRACGWRLVRSTQNPTGSQNP